MKFYKLLKSVFFAAIMLVCLTPVIGVELSAGMAALSVVASYLPMPQNVFGMNNTNNVSARMSYDIARDIFINAWRDSFPNDPAGLDRYVNERKFSQHEIRLETALNATSTNFKFALTPNTQNGSNQQYITENRLNLQDSMIANEYGIFIAQTAGANDTNFKLNTYANTQVFAANNIDPLTNTFYNNGYFKITCNGDVIVPYRGLFNHYNANQTQQTAPLGSGSAQDQMKGAEDGMITMEPNILLIGSKGYIPEIVLPGNLAAAAANLRVILIFRGVLAQNSTSVS